MELVRFTFVTVLVVAGLLVGSPVHAQQSGFPLQIEIITEPQPSFQLNARQWAEAMQKLEQRATFRQGRNGDRTTVEDAEVGRDKVVKIVGILNRDGSITFRGQRFQLNDLEPMKAWLAKLEKYGAAGPPNENPTWGLSEEQYSDLLKLLGKAVDVPVDLSGPMAAVDSLKLPAAFSYRFTDEARKLAFSKAAQIGDETIDFVGLSKGTSLAIALAQFGLGFRALPNPAGGFFIEIDAGGEDSNMYPIGWVNKTPITVAVPALAKSVPVDLVDAQLDGLIELIAQKLTLRHLYSAARLQAEGIDPTVIKYSRKPEKLSPYSLMRNIGNSYKIGMDLRTDEAGTIFLWITTESEYKAFRKRFANVKQ